MAHFKEEYEANGHEVTIQQVNEDGSISAWIDGWAAHIDRAMDSIPSNDITDDIHDKVNYHLENNEELEAIKTTLSFMTDCGIYFCPKCDSFYDYRNAVSTGFAGHKCGDCDREDRACPDNPDGDSHEDECLNPRKKNRARVPTEYRCVHCGRKRQTTPTG